MSGYKDYSTLTLLALLETLNMFDSFTLWKLLLFLFLGHSFVFLVSYYHFSGCSLEFSNYDYSYFSNDLEV